MIQLRKKSHFKQVYFVWSLVILFVSIVAIVFEMRLLLKKEHKNSEPETENGATLGVTEEKKKSLAETYQWFDENFSYAQQITVSNTGSTSLIPNTAVSFKFDHTLLITENKTRADGNDLQLVYLEGATYKALSYSLADSSTDHAQIDFLLVKNILPGMNDNLYFLYYGNSLAQTPVSSKLESKGVSKKTEISYTVSRSEEYHPLVFGKGSRSWVLKGTKGFSEYAQLIYTLNIDKNLDSTNTIPEYTIYDASQLTNLKEISQGKILKSGEDYKIDLPVQSLSPGVYVVQALVKSLGKTYVSQKTPFYVSYPLYVTMTLDWEGSDAKKEALDSVVALQNKHSFPITHFFNPRIYVAKDMSEQRVEELTQWIIERQTAGDEIGMHLHMYYDLVEAAKVEVRKEPKWTNYLDNGHDVPASAYTYDEMKQILAWARDEYLTHGLGSPVSFRAGGWFANIEVLKALNDSGFLIDSSGRDYYVWGNNKLKGYWNLNSLTRPYHPSFSNQNTSKKPTLELMEFSDNGADSYFYKTKDLIKRFDDNYKRVPLGEAQTIVYLSHPHDFTKDFKVLDPVFDCIDQYTVRSDKGPVLYVTLNKANEDFSW
jgi:hypothetical protein